MKNYTCYLQLLILGAVWGGSYLFLRIAAPVLGPFVVTDTRVILGAILLGCYALISRKKVWGYTSIGKLITLAAINCAIPFTLIAFTEMYLTASLGSILNATAPLFSVLISVVVLKERYHWVQYGGFLMGIFGIIVLVGWSPLQLSTSTVLAIVAILVATFFYGLGSIYAARTFPGIPPISLAFCQLVFASLLLLPFALYTAPAHLPSAKILWTLAGLGIFSTGIAYLVFFHLIKNVGANKTLIVTYLIPVFGILWGYLFLGEHIGPSLLVGLAIILSGIFLIYSRKKVK